MVYGLFERFRLKSNDIKNRIKKFAPSKQKAKRVVKEKNSFGVNFEIRFRFFFLERLKNVTNWICNYFVTFE